MKAYSNDFRTKIVRDSFKGKNLNLQNSPAFASYSFVWKLLKRYRQTGKYSHVRMEVDNTKTVLNKLNK